MTLPDWIADIEKRRKRAGLPHISDVALLIAYIKELRETLQDTRFALMDAFSDDMTLPDPEEGEIEVLLERGSELLHGNESPEHRSE